jgi:hypothetical protein
VRSLLRIPWSATALALVVLLSGCGHTGTPTSHTPLPASTPPAALAAAVAGQLIAEVTLPSPIEPLHTLPPGTEGRLEHPASSKSLGRVVDRHRFWAAHESPAKLLAFFARWHPNGGTFISSGSDERDGKANYWSEEFTLPPAAHSLRAERLSVAITRAGSLELVVRIDALVAW